MLYLFHKSLFFCGYRNDATKQHSTRSNDKAGTNVSLTELYGRRLHYAEHHDDRLTMKTQHHDDRLTTKTQHHDDNHEDLDSVLIRTAETIHTKHKACTKIIGLICKL